MTALRLPNDRWHLAEVGFWLVPVACFFLFPGYHVLGSQILIVGLFALSLDIIMGYTGIVSLGHAAFFGIGAYTAGLLAKHGWGEPFSGLLVAMLMSALFGFLTSFLVVRGQGLVRLMVTMGVGLLVFEVANKAAFITGGVDGLNGVTMWKIFGVFRFDFRGYNGYLYTLAVVFVVFLLVRRVIHSPFGLRLRGVRESRARMPMIGASVRRIEVSAFTLSAGVAGIAGGLLAQTTQFVGLDTLSFARSAELLIILVFGGRGHLYGGLIGAAVYMLARDWLAGLNPTYWQFWLGLLLVMMVLVARGGIMDGLALIQRRLNRPAAA